MDNLREELTPPSDFEALRQELAAARLEQAASAEILRIVGRCGGDPSPVFDAILEACQRLYSPYGAAIYLVQGEMAKGVARRGFADGDWGSDATPLAGSNTGRALATRRPVHIENLADVPSLPEDKRATVLGYGGLTALYVPMMSGERGIGSLVVARRPKRPFSEAEIASLCAFADQAAIAIENARLFKEAQSKTRDLEDALAQQTATADVLRVISRSPALALPEALQSLIVAVVKLCADDGVIYLKHGDVFLAEADFSGDVEKIKARNLSPRRPGRDSMTGRVALSGVVEQIPDNLADPEFNLPPAIRLSGIRAMLGVPLLRGREVIGVFVLGRREPGPFSERVIELGLTFADQAVIAIENTRLFEEVRARTRDLEHALERQTATSRILQVIASSPADAAPVFEAIAASANAVVRGRSTAVFRLVDGRVHLAAFTSTSPDGDAELRALFPISVAEFPFFALAAEGRISQLPDTEAAPNERTRAVARARGYRSMAFVPLVKDERPIGLISATRVDPGAFSDADLKQLRAFADQAVIAIENARLFEEVQAKTRDLSEALVHQTASGNILKVIASSPTSVTPALQAVVDSACEVCGAYDAAVILREGDRVRFSAHRGPIPIGLETWPLNRGWVGGRAIVDREAVHVHDLQLAGEEFPDGRDFALRMGHRTILAAPLLREGEALGAIVVRRNEADPFTPKQIELLGAFADQAVIAIENVRLFEQVQARTRDLEESLAQQTATADVLKVISRSAFDLQKVFDTLIASAVPLTGADNGAIYLKRDDAFHVQAHFNPQAEPEFFARLQATPQRPGRESVGGRVLLTGEIVHIADNRLDADYDPALRALTVSRAALGIPLKRGSAVVGAIVLVRYEPGLFAERQIELARTFADQAVIAIENTRLLDEVQARTRELEASLADLRKAQDRLVQSEKLASLGQLTAGIAHEIKNPLNFVNNFAALSRELLDELRETLQQLPDLAKADADDLMGMIDSNLEKVATHGKRADSIVKNMLLHSREGSGERARVNVNAMVEEALNLAYHGARAEKPGFNVTLERDLDPNAGEADVYLQDVTRVLLNLISNGFYASAKRKQTETADYAPTLKASTRDLGHSVEIRIRDNGTGIPDDVRAKMFNPFFTTKPAGEGTGLGLSLSHDIVVKQHGGALDVETEPGAFTEFVITLPRGAAR